MKTEKIQLKTKQLKQNILRVLENWVCTGVILHEVPFIGEGTKLPCAYFLEMTSDTIADGNRIEYFNIRNGENHLDLNLVFFTVMIFFMLHIAVCLNNVFVYF